MYILYFSINLFHIFDIFNDKQNWAKRRWLTTSQPSKFQTFLTRFCLNIHYRFFNFRWLVRYSNNFETFNFILIDHYGLYFWPVSISSSNSGNSWNYVHQHIEPKAIIIRGFFIFSLIWWVNFVIFMVQLRRKAVVFLMFIVWLILLSVQTRQNLK